MSSILFWLDKYSVESVIILVIISALYATWVAYIRYFFKKKYTKDNTKNTNKKTKEQEERKEQLQAREFFPNLEFKINVEVPAEEFSSDPVKRCLYKDILATLFECYYTGMIEFIEHLDVSLDQTEWSSKLNSTNYKIIENFKAKAAEREIPKVVIREFNNWYSPFRKQIYYYIRKIALMDCKDAIENTNTYLLLLELILMNTLADMKNFSSFDGAFEGIEYKGKVIGENNVGDDSPI